jgi:hypothetical protein
MLRAGVLAIAACAGSASVQPTTPPVQREDPCAIAYAEYEIRWRAALFEEITEATEGSIEPAEIEAIVESQVDTLPSHQEIEELRAVYGILDLFVPDAAWPSAFGAAETAIASCGESAPRPTAR